MATYDLLERLNSTFHQIEHELMSLSERLKRCRLLAARVFSSITASCIKLSTLVRLNAIP